MSPGQTLLLLATVQVAAVLSPGPNTMRVIQNAARDRRLGVMAAAGCWPAGVMWVRASRWLDRIAGSAMLFFGARLLVAR